MKRIYLRLIGVCLCIALISSLAVAPAAAQTDEEHFLVELDAEGDADVSMTSAYNLDSDDEQAAFETLRENTTAQTASIERFENRMAAVAEDASAATDREMSVRSADIEFHRSGDVGVVVLSLQWTNLAAVDDDQLTVTEPFASGFDPDRPFTVVLPDGYDIASTTPDPSSVDDTTLTWGAGVNLDNFELTAEVDTGTGDTGADETSPDEGDTEDAVGFGVVTAVVALLSIAALAVRRR